MKKVLLLLMALSLVALAAPAMADDCDVTFDVAVVKDVYKNEFRFIDKFLFLDAYAYLKVDEWAEVEVIKCDENEGNQVIEVFDPDDPNSDFNSDLISEDSFNGFSGIAQVNQSAGSINNQGNVTAIAVTQADQASDNSDLNGESVAALDGFYWRRPSGALAHSQVAVQQENEENCIISAVVTHWDTIENSFTDFSGIAQVNQASGFMNNQNNAVGLAVNLNDPGVVALSDGFLTQENTENNAVYALVDYQARITTSFSGGSGIAQVNQSPGSMNNQANVVSISASGVQ